MPTEIETLKPCPFCGGNELSHGTSWPPQQAIVQCHTDGCGGAIVLEEAEEHDAIAAWNRRADSPIGEQGVGVKALVQEWVKDWWQCGCTDAGCSSRHAERNAVLDDIEETLLPRILSALSPERKEPVGWPKERANIPDPNNPGARIVGFRIREGDEAWGEHGLSEPLFWLGRMCPATPGQPT